MPRGFQRDRSATALMHFRDKRSFVSKPKIIWGECPIQIDRLGRTHEMRPHLILYGQDKAPIRAEIFQRNREANGGVNRCVKCGTEVFEMMLVDYRDDGQVIRRGEWHHVRNKPGERCDCPENGEVICGGPLGCHRDEHPQPRWTAQEHRSDPCSTQPKATGSHA
jgi:hypothetical protein